MLHPPRFNIMKHVFDISLANFIPSTVVGPTTPFQKLECWNTMCLCLLDVSGWFGGSVWGIWGTIRGGKRLWGGDGR